MKSRNSKTTTSESNQSQPTSTGNSQRGLSTTVTGTAKAQARLEGQDPIVTNRKLRASLGHLNVELRKGSDGKIVGCKSTLISNIERAKVSYGLSLTGATEEFVESLLLDMQGRGLAFRNVSDDMADGMVRTYINRLKQYPADALASVCGENWGTWMPSCDQITDRVDKLISIRKEILSALDRHTIVSVEEIDHRKIMFDKSERIGEYVSQLITAEWICNEEKYDAAREQLKLTFDTFYEIARPSDIAHYSEILADAKRILARGYEPRGQETKKDLEGRAEKDRRRLLFAASNYDKLIIEPVKTNGGGPIFYAVIGKTGDNHSPIEQFMKEPDAEAFIKEARAI